MAHATTLASHYQSPFSQYFFHWKRMEMKYGIHAVVLVTAIRCPCGKCVMNVLAVLLIVASFSVSQQNLMKRLNGTNTELESTFYGFTHFA